MDIERLDRIEAALLRLSEATEAGFSGAAGMLRTMNGMVRTMNGMVWTLNGMVWTLNGRMTVVEGQMTEALGRLRIIGQQLATHSHQEGA